MKDQYKIDAFLIGMGLNDEECARFMKIEYGNLITRRSRLAKKYEIKDRGFVKWKDYILSLREDYSDDLLSDADADA